MQNPTKSKQINLRIKMPAHTKGKKNKLKEHIMFPVITVFPCKTSKVQVLTCWERMC